MRHYNSLGMRTNLTRMNTKCIRNQYAGKFQEEILPLISLNITARSPPNDTSLNTPNEISVNIDRVALVAGLRNRNTSEITDLARWLRELQSRMHGRRAGEGWRICIGSGSRELIYRFRALMLGQAVQAMVNHHNKTHTHTHRDSIFVESFVYKDIIPMFETICNPIMVQTDGDGICAEYLRDILESCKWTPENPKPKFLYTVPYGCNPTGITTTTERRKEVLKLAREHDFIILEDDPYYYLYYSEAPRPPSYFALEATESTEKGQYEGGRVVRFDSLTKILSAGMPIGWASGPAHLLKLIERHPGFVCPYFLRIFHLVASTSNLVSIETLHGISSGNIPDVLDVPTFLIATPLRHFLLWSPPIGLIKALWLKDLVLSDVSTTTSSNLQASSLAQVIAHALLKKWGNDGFDSHVRSASEFYRKKRDTFEDAMNKHLKELARWERPEAGMFFWFKLLIPDSAVTKVEMRDAVERLPWAVFWQPENGNSRYVRASFSVPDEDEVNEGLEGLRHFILGIGDT
ncbi:hypothetical protein D9758_018327 [Tetrapyrgos nigripes]|uniref:Aminotransferase class I/classII domain-containing protein n=1 Tax=Tetrapyrgos nigripes TaxID=182062 RepID=A0A8H5FG42_9AGAR|nr:hypothetical protein D9758_018327 [Tetrapyrgos nigripes]